LRYTPLSYHKCVRGILCTKYNIRCAQTFILVRFIATSNQLNAWSWICLYWEVFWTIILVLLFILYIFPWRCGPTRAMASPFTRVLDHTQRHTTVGRNPLEEWSARRRDLYLKTHNTHNIQTSMLPAGFEPTISAGERSQTYELDGAAVGISINYNIIQPNYLFPFLFTTLLTC